MALVVLKYIKLFLYLPQKCFAGHYKFFAHPLAVLWLQQECFRKPKLIVNFHPPEDVLRTGHSDGQIVIVTPGK